MSISALGPKATFLLGGLAVTVAPADLEEIRQRSADYVHASDRADRDLYTSELATASPYIDESGVARVGRWLLEERGGKLYLVRHPAREQVMHFVLVRLQLEHGSWRAVGIEDERVTARGPR